MTRPFGAAVWRWLLITLVTATGCGRMTEAPKMTELQRVTSGTLDVVLLSDHDAIHHGKDTFIVEFRSVSGGNLVDVGQVRATASMPMPGMAMFGNIDVRRTDVAGRYAANGQFDMAGTWRMALEWDGPAGRGSVSFAGTVQ